MANLCKTDDLEGSATVKYGVKVMFTYSVEPDNRTFYEESIYLVDAESFEDAYQKAENYTKDFDTEHTNPKGQKVTTQTIDLIDCFLAFEDDNGVQEIYSATFNNKTSLSEKDFYHALTVSCDAEELSDFRYQQLNQSEDN